MRRLLTLTVACLAFTAVAPAQAHRDSRSELNDVDLAASVRSAQLGAAAEPGDGLPTTWCGTQRTTDDRTNAAFPFSQAQFKVVYAHPSDQPNRFDDFKHALQANVSLVTRFMSAQSGGLKAPRFDMGTDCGPEFVDIQRVTLPSPRSAYVDDFNAIAAAVAAELGSTPGEPRNTFVLADTLTSDSPGWLSGTASRYDDDWPGPDNYANEGGLSAVVFVPLGEASPAQDPDGYWPEGMLHEMAHNLGAVQWSAPHTSRPPGGSTSYGHCWDEWDVMCYADGPDPAHALSYDCPSFPGVIGQEFDCSRDDYFNPAPAPGTYLATYWNLFNSVFLAPCVSIAPACGGSGPVTVPTPPVATADPQVTGTAMWGEVLAASSGTWLNSPTAYAYQWFRNVNESWTAIPGAVQASYTIGDDDIDHRLRVVVTAQNPYGSASVASAATAVVADVGDELGRLPAGGDAGADGAGAGAEVAQTSTGPSSGRATLKVSSRRGRGRRLGSVGFAVSAGRLRATLSPLRLAKGRYVLTVCTTAGGTATAPRCRARKVPVRRSGRRRLPVLSIAVPLGADGRALVRVTAVKRPFAARTAARPAQGVLLGG